MARSLVKYVKMLSTKRRPKLDNVRTLVGIYDIDPEDMASSIEKPGAHKTILGKQDTLVKLRPANQQERALGRLNPEIMNMLLLRRFSIR